MKVNEVSQPELRLAISETERRYVLEGGREDGFSQKTRRTWLHLAVSNWLKMLDALDEEPRQDLDALASVSVALRYQGDAMGCIVLSSILEPHQRNDEAAALEELSTVADESMRDLLLAKATSHRAVTTRAARASTLIERIRQACDAHASVLQMNALLGCIDLILGRPGEALRREREVLSFDPDHVWANRVIDLIPQPPI